MTPLQLDEYSSASSGPEEDAATRMVLDLPLHGGHLKLFLLVCAYAEVRRSVGAHDQFWEETSCLSYSLLSYFSPRSFKVSMC